MKKISIARRGFAFFWASLLVLGLLASGTVCAADAAENAVRFAELDEAAEKILNEVTVLGGEMAALEEARVLSPKTQLLVLVTVDPSPFFQLDAVQLQIDEHPAAYHQYTEPELAALQQGGSHRLFWDNVPAGRHQLTVSMMGRVPKDPDFQRESTMMVISGVGRRVVELRVASGKSQPFPEISLKEWK
jgi:hypothetical protein